MPYPDCSYWGDRPLTSGGDLGTTPVVAPEVHVSSLARRTTLVVVSLALVATGCAGKKKAAAPAATSASATTAPPSAAPTSASPTPAATESPAPKADPAALAKAKTLLVTGKDFGNGWKEELDEVTGPDPDAAFCADGAPKSEADKVFAVSADVTNPAAPQDTFNHEVSLYQSGKAKAAIEEFNTLAAACKPIEQEGVSLSAKATGKNTADVTMKFGEVTAFGAMRLDVRGDYISSVFALGKTHAAARKLADQVTAKAGKKFDVAGVA
jgi:hypothetical protein